MEHDDSFRINIDIEDMHRPTDRILDVSTIFNNIQLPIHEIVCVGPQLCYLDFFEKSHPNFPINQYCGPFCLQCMNVIQGTKPSGRQLNQLLDAVITMIKYKK